MEGKLAEVIVDRGEVAVVELALERGEQSGEPVRGERRSLLLCEFAKLLEAFGEQLQHLERLLHERLGRVTEPEVPCLPFALECLDCKGV